MNLNSKKAVFFAILITLFSSCASIVSKSNWPVSFETDPPKATVTVKDKKGNLVYEGKTPSAIKLKSGSGFLARHLIL